MTYNETERFPAILKYLHDAFLIRYLFAVHYHIVESFLIQIFVIFVIRTALRDWPWRSDNWCFTVHRTVVLLYTDKQLETLNESTRK